LTNFEGMEPAPNPQ